MRTLIVMVVVLLATLFVVAPVAQAQSYGSAYPSTAPTYGFGFCPPHPLTFAYTQPSPTYTQATDSSTSSGTYAPVTSGHSLGWSPTMGFHYGYWPMSNPPPAVVPSN